MTDTIRAFMRRGVVVRTVINAMEFDGATTDPMKQAVRDALIARLVVDLADHLLRGDSLQAMLNAALFIFVLSRGGWSRSRRRAGGLFTSDLL